MKFLIFLYFFITI